MIYKDIDLAGQQAAHEEKKAYWVMAMCSAAIGFAVVRSESSQLDFYLTPWLMAVGGWSLAIFIGLRSRTFAHNLLNITRLLLRDPSPEDNLRLQAKAKEISNALISAIKLQDRLFIGSSTAFLAWHLLALWRNG